MTTERRLLARLSVASATMRAAVPEHSICASGWHRKAARFCSNDAPEGIRSRHDSGRPAVGETSRIPSVMRLPGLTQAQKHDTQYDAERPRHLHDREMLAEIDDGDNQHKNNREM